MPSSPSKEPARGDALFRELDILAIRWATGDLPEECRFLLSTQLMFLKKEEEPTSKRFDDDEWIRSLTEAQEVTTDRGQRHYDHQHLDPKKVRPWRIPAEIRFAKAPRRRNCSPDDFDAANRSRHSRWRRSLGHLPSAPPR